MNASSVSLTLSLHIDTTLTTTTTTTACDAAHDDTNLMLPEFEHERAPSVSESDGITLVDEEGTTPAVATFDDKLASPVRSPVVRKRRVYNVFGLLTNRYMRSRKAKAAAAASASAAAASSATATPSSPTTAPTAKPKKQKKAKPFKYKGEMLNNPQDQFILQCITRLQMFGACNIRDAALIVENEWRARGVREDKMPQYECPDKHTLVVPESTVWLAEHEPERLAQYFADRKLGVELPF